LRRRSGGIALRIAAALILLACATTVRAQDLGPEPDPAESARFHWGPVRFTPWISVSNLGVDNNVFNEAADPKSDRTAAIGPAVQAWTQLGLAHFTLNSAGQYIYYSQYENQRAWNTSNSLAVAVPLTHLRPFASAGYLDTAERPGYEIDTRARRRDTMFKLGTEVRATGKTAFVFSTDYLRMAFDQGTFYDGVNLADTLNRTTLGERVQFRYALTPLTTFTIDTGALQDRFLYSPERDANTIQVLPGFEFKPFALIAGRAQVGIRHFDMSDQAAPDYDGLVASVDARYTLVATQFNVRVAHDVAFSYEIERPYYTLTDTSLAVTQRVTVSWDLIGRLSAQTLSYRNLETVVLPQRVDHTLAFGGGIGYRVGRMLRLGMDINYSRREAPTDVTHEYSGVRSGISISYGPPQ